MLEFEDPTREEYQDALLALACSLASDSDPNSNWVEKAGGLPDYICRVAKHIKEKGSTTSSAIAQAISTIKRWIATGSPETKAKASAAIAQWEKMKASTKLTGLPIHEDMDLVMLTNGTKDPVPVNDEYLQWLANNDNAAMLSGCGCGTGVPSGVIELADWQEALHPRDTQGQFAPKVGGAIKRAFTVGDKAGYVKRSDGGLSYIGERGMFNRTISPGNSQFSQKGFKNMTASEALAAAQNERTAPAPAKGKTVSSAQSAASKPTKKVTTAKADVTEPVGKGADVSDPKATQHATEVKERRALNDASREKLYDAARAKGYSHDQALASAYSLWTNKELWDSYDWGGDIGPLQESNNDIWSDIGSYYPKSIPTWLAKRLGNPKQRYTEDYGMNKAAYDKSVGLDTGLSVSHDPLLVALGDTEPYGNVTYADPGYQSDGVKRYPLDSEAHCRAAWSYINMPKNAGKYSPDQLAKIKAKIKRALAKYTKEEPVSASMGESFLEAWDKDRVELHGVAGQPGYAFLHSPSPQVYSAAQRLYETGRRRGLDVASAQAVIQRIENADSYRRHISAGGNRLMRTVEGQTVPVGKGSHDDIASGGHNNKPISVPVLDMLEGANDLEGAHSRARDLALQALRAGDDRKAAEILDAATQETPNDTFANALQRLGYESVPDGFETDNFTEENFDEPKEVDSYDTSPGSLLDAQPDKFGKPISAAPESPEKAQRPLADVVRINGASGGQKKAVGASQAQSSGGGMSQPTGMDTGGGAQSGAMAAPVAASFLRQFSENEVELAVRRVQDVAYWKLPKGTPIRDRSAGGVGPKA